MSERRESRNESILSEAAEKAFEVWWQKWRAANGYPNTDRMRWAARSVYESLAYSSIDAAVEQLREQGALVSETKRPEMFKGAVMGATLNEDGSITPPRSIQHDDKHDRIDQETLERNADAVNKALQDYLSDYEFRGDDGGHTPTEVERLLIEDAIQGLMVEDEFVDAFVKMHNGAHAPRSAGRPIDKNGEAFANDLVQELGHIHAGDIKAVALSLARRVVELERASPSVIEPSEGYPGIAHDFETLRKALSDLLNQYEGVYDCRDNTGKAYQSQAAADAETRARAALAATDRSGA